ncbi:MAG: hypothetical protein Q4F41_02320 [Eubacteriales bacterium]|nr:hypothetical protein [Eubacteriales bacterium]
MENWTPAHFEAKGTIQTQNGPVSYLAISEDHVFYDETGAPEATIFSYSYFRADAPQADRPVLFVYNGGPGSSCVWMHTGMMGPWRMKYEDAVHPPVNPPYEMKENDDWLLDTCDIVMVDPVGTGYARLLKPEKAERYYGPGNDAWAIAEFIEAWLRKYDRRNSPIYLAGESYGTIRTPLLVQELMCGPTGAAGKMRGIPVKGVLLLGTVLDIGATPLPVPREPMDLYTEAAVAWYHKPEGKKPLRGHLEDAWKFGTGKYLTSLYLKNSLSAQERQELAETLTYFTDVDAAYFKEHDYRITLDEFSHQVGKSRGFDVGLYDGRYTMPHTERTELLDPVIDDPAMGAYTPSMTAAMETILKKKLNIVLDREYKAIAFKEVNMHWKFEYLVPPRTCLERAARRNPDFRIFLGAGLYDLVTSPGYARALKNQLDVAPEQIVHHEYESGHMPYLGEESFHRLVGDIRAFIR